MGFWAHVLSPGCPSRASLIGSLPHMSFLLLMNRLSLSSPLPCLVPGIEPRASEGCCLQMSLPQGPVVLLLTSAQCQLAQNTPSPEFLPQVLQAVGEWDPDLSGLVPRYPAWSFVSCQPRTSTKPSQVSAAHVLGAPGANVIPVPSLLHVLQLVVYP